MINVNFAATEFPALFSFHERIPVYAGVNQPWSGFSGCLPGNHENGFAVDRSVSFAGEQCVRLKMPGLDSLFGKLFEFFVGEIQAGSSRVDCIFKFASRTVKPDGPSVNRPVQPLASLLSQV